MKRLPLRLPAILFVVFVASIIKAIFAGHHTSESDTEEKMEADDTAFQILRERYAKGEITKRQYMDMKKDLS